ncbi:MAG TPA: sigma factor G inhibitor Gin [Bacillota bacterium]|nr:sigma factor G inhibitor Gin [Bacillota bacterium]
MTSLTCFGCGATIAEGLKICGQYLCPTCESKIVESKAGKSDYEFWIERCRRFWDNLKPE